MYNFKGFTQKANDALNGAIKVASELGHTYVGTEHLLLALTHDRRTTASDFRVHRPVLHAEWKHARKRQCGGRGLYLMGIA